MIKSGISPVWADNRRYVGFVYKVFVKYFLLFQCDTDADSPSIVTVTTAVSSGKDAADQELFDFLNNSSPAVNESQKSDGRPSSSASSQSQKTPELPVFVADVAGANDLIGSCTIPCYQTFSAFMFSDYSKNCNEINTCWKVQLLIVAYFLQSAMHMLCRVRISIRIRIRIKVRNNG